MRLLFWALGLAYFNLGGAPQTSSWVSLGVVNVTLAFYGAEILFFMWHAARDPRAAWRRRLTMWLDLAATSFAILADPAVISPGFLAFLMVILGNGMRYGLRLFAEAVAGALACALAVVALRAFDYVNAVSVSAMFFLLFFAIITLYSYSLTAQVERGRERLAQERNLDALTGLLNRRALFEHAARLGAAAGGEPAVVLFADLDRFKELNDTHGHHAGDRALAEVARCALAAVRASDLVARYGGDEFLLLLPATTGAGGTVVARRLQQAVEDWARAQGFELSVSIGLGQLPDHGPDLESVIARVDRAMYQSKLAYGRRGGILHVDAAPQGA
jgi:diguanylate cyclase (GGDEF)-like protein